MTKRLLLTVFASFLLLSGCNQNMSNPHTDYYGAEDEEVNTDSLEYNKKKASYPRPPEHEEDKECFLIELMETFFEAYNKP